MADPLGRFVGAVPAGVWWSAMTISADESSALIASLRETSEWANEQPAGDDFWPLMGKLLGCAADEILSLLDRLAALEAQPDVLAMPEWVALDAAHLAATSVTTPGLPLIPGGAERARSVLIAKAHAFVRAVRPLAADGGATPEPDDEASDEDRHRAWLATSPEWIDLAYAVHARSATIGTDRTPIAAVRADVDVANKATRLVDAMAPLLAPVDCKACDGNGRITPDEGDEHDCPLCEGQGGWLERVKP